MINLDYLTDLYFCNGEPVPYKLSNDDVLYIYPIKLKDYILYESSVDVLIIPKNEINDIRVIQMSYLEFLVNAVFADSQNGELYLNKLATIVKLCLHYEYFSFDYNKNKMCLCLCDKDKTIEHIISKKEFDEIIKIILNQNNAKYDNRYISPDAREMMEEYYRIKYKDTVTPSLEKRKAFVCSKMGKTYVELNDMLYREFDMIYNACVESEMYLATKVTEASYKYEVKNPTVHPLFQPNTDPYAEVFEDPSILSSKGIKGAEQLNAMNLAE